MKKRRSSSGFTIVESLVVLGISGVLFASLVVMVSGQQAKARFKSSMTDIRSEIQQNINEVSAGFYPSNADFSCQNLGGNVNVTFGSGSEQGSNEQCIFLGRAMMFGIPSSGAEQYKIQTLIGVRNQTNGREVTSMRGAATRALGPGVAYNPSWQDKSETRVLQYGTSVGWMRRADGAEVAGIAIITSPTQTNYGTGGALDSGSVITEIVPIRKVADGDPPGVGAAQGVDLIARILGIPGSDPQALQSSADDGPTEICFVSGGTDESGLITIGANNSTTAVDMIIYGNRDCSD